MFHALDSWGAGPSQASRSCGTANWPCCAGAAANEREEVVVGTVVANGCACFSEEKPGRKEADSLDKLFL